MSDDRGDDVLTVEKLMDCARLVNGFLLDPNPLRWHVVCGPGFARDAGLTRWGLPLVVGDKVRLGDTEFHCSAEPRLYDSAFRFAAVSTHTTHTVMGA